MPIKNHTVFVFPIMVTDTTWEFALTKQITQFFSSSYTTGVKHVARGTNLAPQRVQSGPKDETVKNKLLSISGVKIILIQAPHADQLDVSWVRPLKYYNKL